MECGRQMEIGKQIRKYRTELGLSQDGLADRVFVTRQTISNWENDRNYPDIRSLVLLAEAFGISLDILVKGDLEQMREEIRTEDVRRFNRDGMVYTALMIAMIVVPVPLMALLGWIGIAVWGMLAAVTVYWAFRLERQKRAHDVQTYKEIVAFTEGKRLDEIQRNQEIGKRPYQKILIVLALVAITSAVTLLMAWLLL